MNFLNMKIGARLALALGTVTALLLLVVAVALVQMRSMSADTTEITSNWLPSVERVNQMNTASSDLRIAEMQHVMNTDDSAMEKIEKSMGKTLAEFKTTQQAYVKLISSDVEQKLYDSFLADWTQYLQIHEQVIALSRKNANDQAKSLLEGKSRELFDHYSDTLEKLIALNHAGATQATEASNATYAMARNLMLGCALVALAFAVGVSVFLIRSITQPLNRAVLEADRVAQGDLSGQIADGPSDETGLLLAALQRMQASLTETVGAVRGNAESVATASAEIAQGNADLSQRTEEQASALQQTAATMDQLSSTVRNNADNAKQANQLAAGASEVAAKGGVVVSQVVSTMKGINDSSKRIADIISVIDGIAFQTNILALNAAVEAARAGEQGRGFAVVASEVRTLAQRSAAAAKEIKTLITDSVEQVERGTELVDEAGKTMEEIVGAIRRVGDIVGEISEASVEQSAGVTQVGQAVSQMDQVTQQNAALVEESAAAAESLRQQARQLVEVVSVFKLRGGAQGY